MGRSGIRSPALNRLEYDGRTAGTEGDMLENKVTAVFAATGAIGSEAARALGRRGATVYVSGRRKDALESLALEVRRAGGKAHAAVVDAMDESQIAGHLEEISGREGRLDGVFNPIGLRPLENEYGTPSEKLSFPAFLAPFQHHVGSQFLTARAAIRHMQPGSTILMLTASLSTDPRPLMAGITAACAAIEGLSRMLAAELGPRGISVICLRAGGMHETRTIQETIRGMTRTLGVDPAAFEGEVQRSPLLKRPVTVRETAEVVAFLLSDPARCMTGDTVNASCGLALT